MKKNIVKIYKVKHLINNDVPYATQHSEQTIEYDEGKEPTLEELQEWVGGYIEVIKMIHDDRECMGIINEEGKLKDLPFNLNATVEYHEWMRRREFELDDVIVGNCAVMTNFDLQ